MTTAKDKIAQRKFLVANGYFWDYLKEWPLRQNMWRHTPWLNNEGAQVKPVGTLVPNLPGNPDAQMRLSRQGLLPWEPGETCLSRNTAGGFKGCKGCRERAEAPVFEPPPVNGTHSGNGTLGTNSGTALEDTVAPEPHTHRYRGRSLGAPCAIGGCTVKRSSAFKHRKQAAVTMAEAAE